MWYSLTGHVNPRTKTRFCTPDNYGNTTYIHSEYIILTAA